MSKRYTINIFELPYADKNTSMQTPEGDWLLKDSQGHKIAVDIQRWEGDRMIESLTITIGVAILLLIIIFDDNFPDC